MSVPSNLEFLRKEAKALLKQCRSGNAQAIGRIRLQLAWAAHGSKHRSSAEEDYCAIVNTLVDAGADYEAAGSRSGVRPEDIASASVAVLLGRRWKA